jgi:hypothetical protein
MASPRNSKTHPRNGLIPTIGEYTEMVRKEFSTK